MLLLRVFFLLCAQDWMLFWWPTLFYIVVGSFSMIAIMVTICITSRRAGFQGSQWKQVLFRFAAAAVVVLIAGVHARSTLMPRCCLFCLCVQHLRPMLFLVGFLSFYTFVFGIKVQSEFRKPSSVVLSLCCCTVSAHRINTCAFCCCRGWFY